MRDINTLNGARTPAQPGKAVVYKTTDIKLAAFLKAKEVQLVGHNCSRGTGQSGLREFQFNIEHQQVAELILQYQNHSAEAMVDASTLLNEYENLKALRYT